MMSKFSGIVLSLVLMGFFCVHDASAGRILASETQDRDAEKDTSTLTTRSAFGHAADTSSVDERVNESGARTAIMDAHGIRTLGVRTIRAGADYQAGPVLEFFLGEEYRDVWELPLEVPVIDLGRTAGGLTPTGSAGGIQTSLLFLEGEDGRDFILRKLEKEAGDALPEGTRRTIVEDIARDQVSSLNPYGAFVVAPMAEAAGVLHTAPTLVVIPDDPRLGEYREEFAGALAMLERKVDEDVTDAARFAYSEEVIDFDEMLERVDADAGTQIDQKAYVRARLFDMFLGDRDRHDGQWFWATADGGTRLLPLPIDRDFAFAKFDGLVPKLGRFSGKTALRKMTYFDEDIRNLVGLNHQGAKLDIRFTSELDREDWIEIARALQADLTDEVIDNAIREWPQPVFDEIGHETIEALKARRADLPNAADEYYEMLVQKVDVVGSNEPETFTLTRLDDERIDLTIGQNGRDLYHRTFLTADTDELRIYGQGGNDEFIVDGAPTDDMLVMIVGGDGADLIRENSTADLGHVRYYDTDGAATTGVAFRQLEDAEENTYQLHRYQFDRAGPAFSFDYDSEEGIYLGGGVKLFRYGFKREPYAARHRIVANYSPRSQGFNVHYDGRLNEIAGAWGADMEADVLDVDRFDDFYGLGNETSGSDLNRRQYIARFRWIRAYPAMMREIGSRTSLSLGPYFEYADIEPPQGVSEDAPLTGFTAEQFVDKYFAGILSRVVVDGRDTTALPTRGARFVAEAGLHAGVRNTDNRFGRLATELSYFLTPVRPVTVAVRAGGATNFGDFTFYQANTIGGRQNLRGFRKTRFAGRSSAFANGEVRLRLTDFNVYLTRGELGVFGFYDIGRVWTDGESSSVWHSGYGAGAWATPFYQLVVSGSLGFSNEGSVFNVSAGMFF